MNGLDSRQSCHLTKLGAVHSTDYQNTAEVLLQNCNQNNSIVKKCNQIDKPLGVTYMGPSSLIQVIHANERLWFKLIAGVVPRLLKLRSSKLSALSKGFLQVQLLALVPPQ